VPAHVLPELDGLRGLAILIVLLFHCGAVIGFVLQGSGRAALPAPLALIRAGHTGVTLFFVLSAFLLSLPLLRRQADDRFDTRAFYRRRALRILPLYWCVLVAGGVLAATRWEDVLRVIPHLVFANGVSPAVPKIHPYTDVTWSLATEAQFYLLLPALPWALASRGRRRLGWVVLGCGAAVYGALLGGAFIGLMGPAGWFVGLTVVGRAPVFVCGILAAWVYLRFGDRLRHWRPLAVWGDVALVGCFVALELLLRPVAREGFLRWEFPPYVAWHVVEGALWAAVLLLVIVAPLRLRRVFVSRAMAWLGLVSYSIYLLHWPMLLGSGRLLRRAFPGAGWDGVGVAWLVGTVAAIGVLSALTYRFIERPFLVRKASPRRRVRDDAEAPPPALASAGGR
jgi:peptidoglycan/LPS O-acetylase OafA/YrhL